MPLMLPPLRSRRGDVRALAEHFVRALAPREQTVRFGIAALDKLEQHPWPGNVRELRNDRDRTARVLGMGRSSLYRRLKALGLEAGDEEAG